MADNVGVVEVLILLAIVAAVIFVFRHIVQSTVRDELGKAERHRRMGDSVE